MGKAPKRPREEEQSEPPKKRKAEGSVHLRSLQLSGLPSSTTKEELQSWVEERLPGGSGIESLRRVVGHPGRFAISFRKDHNARRALESLSGADMNGHAVAATLRALELSRHSSKAGRLIVRNLSFNASEKHLQKAFQAAGQVVDIHVPKKDADPSLHRGFAFVQFAESGEAEKAVAELNGAKICGRTVAVDWAVDASVYNSLQREEVPKPRKEKRLPKKPVEDEKEEDDEEADPDKELKRMKELLGDDIEEDDEDEDQDEKNEDDEEEEEETTKKVKGKKKKTDAKAPKRKPGFDIEQGQTIFVRNVPFDASEDDLREVFRRFGKVRFVKLTPDKTGQNAHRGSAFVKFVEAEGAEAALQAESEADRKLKELSSVIKRSEQRELPAVEGFGISLKGRRLVVKPAVAPTEAAELSDKTKPQKGQAQKERRAWMHLLNVGDIDEDSPRWQNLSKSEQRQRQEGRKERRWRINNSNFAIHPQRLSIRNMPTFVDANKLREVVVKNLAEVNGAEKRKERQQLAQSAVVKACLVRDKERREESGARRSKGFAFIAFKDHDSAMKTLQFLNDNPQAFGGGRRPIVEFAVEDKRKLRMQEEERKSPG
ncbi:unnamed protein product [Effrenium voratum]|nr:unnamed protein product [Effrenium voratum]